MKILFRPHRALLADAMKEVVEVFHKSDLVNYLNKKNKFGPDILVENLTIKHYCYDERIQWDTFIVCDQGNAIGFTNGPL